MGLDNFIETAMNKVLKNPIIEVLRDINFASILKQSNFKKRDIGVKPYMIILQFWPPLHKGTKCDMRFKSSLNSARLNLLNPYK